MLWNPTDAPVCCVVFLQPVESRVCVEVLPKTSNFETELKPSAVYKFFWFGGGISIRLGLAWHSELKSR